MYEYEYSSSELVSDEEGEQSINISYLVQEAVQE